MAQKAGPWFRSDRNAWFVWIGGKQVKLVAGKENKVAAVDRWHQLMVERAANPVIDAPEHTVASVIDIYLTHIRGKRAARTYAHCSDYLQRFAEAHGYRLVSECKAIHLTTWLDQNPQWASDWTLSSVVSIVQRPFNWAVGQDLIERNPFRSVRRRRGTPRRPITDEEFRSLLRATAAKGRGGKRKKRRKRPTAGERFRALLFFLRWTGARPGEAAALTWSDVDLKEQVIVLHKHKTSTTQRDPKPRVIPLVPQVIKLLIRIRRFQPKDAKHVFLTMRGTPWTRTNLGRRVARLRENAGLPSDVTLYTIRHRFGTQSIVNGVDLKTLSQLLGHTSTRMTEHYVHLAGQHSHLAAAMQQAVSSRRET